VKGDGLYSLFRSLPLQQSVMEQVPALGISLMIAELFYKFHSFTLECLAFLATWYLLDLSIQGAHKLVRRNRGGADSADTYSVLHVS
jgi:hypothetical protein